MEVLIFRLWLRSQTLSLSTTLGDFCSGGIGMVRVPVFQRICIIVIFLLAAVGFVNAGEVTMRVMPAPPSPEADFTPENTHGWDVSVGYGRIWMDGPVELPVETPLNIPLDKVSLDGFVTGLTYDGTIGGKVGVTLAPLYGGMYFGNVDGFSADSLSMGTGFSFGTRLLGKADTSNVVLFGGGGYTYALDQQEQAEGSYRADAHLFGFNTGVKVQVAFHRFVRIVPFYLYLGGGGSYNVELEDNVFGTTFGADGSLGYRDAHILGLDFNIFGVTAKLIADLFRDDYSSFTISIDILGTVRGVKNASARWKDIKETRALLEESS